MYRVSIVVFEWQVVCQVVYKRVVVHFVLVVKEVLLYL